MDLMKTERKYVFDGVAEELTPWGVKWAGYTGTDEEAEAMVVL